VSGAFRERYGPYALVAGGSEGVGAAFAWQLAAAGIGLVLVSRDAGKLDALAGEITTMHSVDVRTLALDLSRADMLEALAAVTDNIDIGLLVCNVGATFGGGAFVDTALDDLLRTIRLNSILHVSLAHRFGGRMAARGRGGIVLIGSLAGNAGSASMVLYGASKAFAQNLAEGLWAELGPRGVDVLYVVLGATDTPVRARLGLVDPPGLILADPEDVAREALARIGDGPVLVPAHLEEGFRMFSSLPRRQAAEAMRDLLGGFSPD
jgi:hypothetical protein